MKYALIVNGIVEQIDIRLREGFIKVKNNIHCGMIYDDIAKTFSNPIKPESELLDDVKLIKKQELKKSFELESNKPVVVNEVNYVGGFDSAVKLDAAKRMLETALATEVTFFDVDNKPNVLSIGDATNVILAIGSKYQTDFAKYQGLKVQVDSKLKVSTVNSIVW